MREHIALVDELTFFESDADELAIDAAADGDGVEGGDRAEAVEINGQIAVLRGGDDHGNNWRAARACRAASALAAAGRLPAAALPRASVFSASALECEPR